MLKQISQCSLLKPIGTNSINLPTPLNISLWWNLGSMLSVALMVQILTGLFLASHYSPWTDSAFDSIININREVTGGWLMRALHANGASLFFVFLYLHISRGLYYGSYTKHKVWNVGVLIFIISMATAFVGYVLVWGQMSFWGATVITNLLSAIPYVGSYIVYWLWGGFGVANATLNRFFVFHFILPFIIAAGAVTHLILLHDKGSANPTGLAPSSAKILFQPYFSAKDVKGFMILFLLYGALTLLAPMFFLDSENFLPANPGVTPEHIKPEWYFLWAYAILRSIPDKLSGVIMMFAAILILFALPKMWRANMGALHHYPSAKMVFWFLVSSMLLLTWIGGCPIEDPYVILGRLFTGWLFLAYFSIPMVIKSYDLMLWPSEPILTLEDVVEMSLIWEMLPETLPQIIQYSTTMLPDLMNLAPDPSETFNYISNYMDPEAPPPYTANPAPATIPQPMSASDPAINMQPLSHMASSLNTQISSISDPVITSQPVSSASLPLPSDTDPGVIMRPCTCTECLRAAGLAMSIIIPVPTAYAILFITLKFCCV